MSVPARFRGPFLPRRRRRWVVAPPKSDAGSEVPRVVVAIVHPQRHSEIVLWQFSEGSKAANGMSFSRSGARDRAIDSLAAYFGLILSLFMGRNLTSAGTTAVVSVSYASACNEAHFDPKDLGCNHLGDHKGPRERNSSRHPGAVWSFGLKRLGRLRSLICMLLT